MSLTTIAKQKAPPKTLAGLNRLRPLTPIRSDTDLTKAQCLADRLAVLDRPTRDQADYLETLSLLIENYEDTHHAIDLSKLDPIGTLRFLMDQHDMNASDLGRLLGNRQIGSAILRGKRQLSKTHIQKLCEHFAVSANVFL